MASLSRSGRREFLFAIAISFIISILAVLVHGWKSDSLSSFFIDPWSRNSIAEPDSRIVILGVDAKTLKILRDQYGISNRDVLTLRLTIDALTRLKTDGASVVGIDYLFLPRLPFDSDLARIVRAYPKVVFALSLVGAGASTGAASGQAQLVGGEHAFLNGEDQSLSNLYRDPSGVVSGIPLLNEHNPGLPPPFPFRLYEVYRNQSDRAYLAHIERRSGMPILPIRFRTTSDGPEELFTTFKLEDFLRGSLPPGYFKNKVVLIGQTGATSVTEIRLTPVGDAVPIVVVHAEALKMLMEHAYIRQLPASLIDLLILVFGVGAGGVAFHASRKILTLVLFLGVFLALAYQIGSILYARAGFFIDLSGIYLSVIPSALFASIYQYYETEKERREIRDAFSHYVGSEVLNEFLANRNLLAPQGTRREATILFADIRGFTSFSEKKDPEEVVAQLREFFGAVASQVIEFGGYINKFLGDGFMAIFGVPEEAGHALQAIKAAYAMLLALKRQNKAWLESGGEELEIGIGICSGTVIWGNMGLPGKMEFTVTGDTVNTAARIQDLTKQYPGYPVLLGEPTRDLLKPDSPDVPIDFVGEAAIRGKSASIRLFGIPGASVR